MKKAQIFNPYLPSYEYVPDGEPHVFGDRVYVYGSHDRFNGGEYCVNDYVCWSADVNDLTQWRYEGVIYRKMQDPRNADERIARDYVLPQWSIDRQHMADLAGSSDRNPPNVHAMWAPDVGQGPDGRFYLYYCLDYYPEVAVAVCDTPAGRYEFLDYVRYEDGTPLGRAEGDIVMQFDPAVYVEGDRVYLYSGNGPIYAGEKNWQPTGPIVMELAADMKTIIKKPRRFVPTADDSQGTGFEGHEFFEGSSIRKFDDTYYFIYSSTQFAELCYAMSKYPDRDYVYGGTAVHIADVGIDGRTYEQGVNITGNTHGSIERINGEFYVFYHRQTNRTDYSRQGCAERIRRTEDGRFLQAEVTSCGLNPAPLAGEGKYPARICCHLRGKKGITSSTFETMKNDYPYLTQGVADIGPEHPLAQADSETPVQYITNLADCCTVGYKYFDFAHPVQQMGAELRGTARGTLYIYTDLEEAPVGSIALDLANTDWCWSFGSCTLTGQRTAVYFRFVGEGTFDFRSFLFK